MSYIPRNDRLPRKPDTLNERLLKPASYRTIEKSGNTWVKRTESGRFITTESQGGKVSPHEKPIK